VENGRIVLPPDVRLPDNARVYVILPGVKADHGPASPGPPGCEQVDEVRKAGEALLALAGSWQGDETPEELAASIRRARRSGRRFNQVPDPTPAAR